MVLDYAISAKKYPKIVTQEKKKIQGIPNSVFQKYVVFYGVLTFFFYMFKCINPTFHQNKKCSWDKTGEGIMVLDYAISAHKYPKIVPQEKKKITPQSHQFSEINGFAKIYFTKGIRLKKIILSPPPCTPFPSIGGGAVLLISLPSSN